MLNNLVICFQSMKSFYRDIMSLGVCARFSRMLNKGKKISKIKLNTQRLLKEQKSEAKDLDISFTRSQKDVLCSFGTFKSSTSYNGIKKRWLLVAGWSPVSSDPSG